MRRFIPLLLAAVLALPSIAAASTSTSGARPTGPKLALFGMGKNRAKKAPKAPKAKRSKKAGKTPRHLKSSR